MAYRRGTRHELMILPDSIEQYVRDDNPVRVYDAFVDNLDLSELGLHIEKHPKAGNPEYHPRTLLKVALYGYSYGERSSRKIERALYHNLSFIWLTGGLKISYRTIARFRQKNLDVLKKLLKECAKLCINLNLISGNTLFVDGSKIKADASPDQHYTKEYYEKLLEKVDKQIVAILKECSRTDKQERKLGSFITMGKELVGKEKLKAKLEKVLKKIKKEDRKSANLTDPDCVKIKSRQGKNSGYNMQVVVDNQHGFIVHADVVAESNDINQFDTQMSAANETLNETLGKNCENASADAGYSNVKELKEFADKTGANVVVPSPKQAQKEYNIKPISEFDKENFIYDEKTDTYICPAGKILSKTSYRSDAQGYIYRIEKNGGAVCRACSFFKECTKSSNGRQILRSDNEEIRKEFEEKYLANKALYNWRKCRAELPFAYIKRILGITHFQMRGLDAAKAEGSLLATCFNFAKLIKMFGVKTLVAMLMDFGRQKYLQNFCFTPKKTAA